MSEIRQRLNNKVIRTEVSERHRWRKRVQNSREN